MKFDLIQIVVICLLTGMTSLLAHGAMAVFHDGIRPILPEFVEGRMKRQEVASVAFGLSVGFIASVGISFTLATGLFNPWLLFLPTDIIGVSSPKKWIAGVAGALWGLVVVVGLTTVNTVLTGLPVDFLTALGELSGPVVSAFALFPILAIFLQFGKKKGIIAAVLVLITRVLLIKFTTLYPESFQLLVGMVLLLIFAVMHDHGSEPVEEDDDAHSIFENRTKRIRKNLPYLAITGALIALAANLDFFAGSEVSIYLLKEAYAATDLAEAKNLINQAAIAETMRGLSFIPLIATTALSTGVYGVAGLTFVYVVGYISPHWTIALILGALVIVVEVFLLRKLGSFFERFPSIRMASDNIRSAMNMSMELALLLGAMFAVIKMGGYTGFFIGAMIYLGNEAMGKPIMKLAVGPIAAIITGVLLNLLYFLNLFTPLV
jgi:hypothetical protein